VGRGGGGGGVGVACTTGGGGVGAGGGGCTGGFFPHAATAIIAAASTDTHDLQIRLRIITILRSTPESVARCLVVVRQLIDGLVYLSTEYK
jgi:hypothetical protein